MPARLQGSPGDLEVRLMDGQVEDGVDLIVGKKVVEGVVGADAVLPGERAGPGRVEIGGCDQPDLRVGPEVTGVPAAMLPVPTMPMPCWVTPRGYDIDGVVRTTVPNDRR